jgi:hypothetical protein
MNPPPKVRLYESYVKKAEKFFSRGNKNGCFEFSALVTTLQEKDYVTITDIILPKKRRILVTTDEELERISEINSDKYELIASPNNCLLTRRYLRRVQNCCDGIEHQHTDANELRPSTTDIIYLAKLLGRVNPQSNYLIHVIRRDKELGVFCFRKTHIQQLTEQEFILSSTICEWYENKCQEIKAKDIEIIKDK